MNSDPIAPSGARRETAQFKPARPPAHVRLLRRLGLARPNVDLDDLAQRVLLPSLRNSDEDHARTQLRDTGQRLARQEDWAWLAEQIAEADAARLHTPGGKAEAALLAEGARNDVVAAAWDAVRDGRAPDPAGLDAFEQVRADYSDIYPIVMVVALSHMDIGRAWRECTAKDIDARDREARFLSHFQRAEELLDPFDPVSYDAPSLAAAQCALLDARPAPRRRVADDYCRLIALDPDSAQNMRALGEALLPSRFGSFEELDREARRMAGQTGSCHGAASYAWVWFDALAIEPAGLGTVDPRFFVEGLHAIAAQKPDQHIVNELAAFCGVTMAPRLDAALLPASQDKARAAIHACLEWLVARHLHELHPLIWSEALTGPAPSASSSRRSLVARGRQVALRVIAEHFADDLADGHALGFSSSGMYRLPTP